LKCSLGIWTAATARPKYFSRYQRRVLGRLSGCFARHSGGFWAIFGGGSSLLSVGLLATVVVQFPFGHLADKGFVRPIIMLGVFSIASVDLLFLRAENYWHLLVFYVPLRAAGGVYHPVSFSTIFRSAGHRSREMGFQYAFGDGSLAFAHVSTGFISESYGWHVPFLAWGAASLVGAVAVSFLTGTWRTSHVGRGTVNSVSRDLDFRHFAVLQFTTSFLQSRRRPLLSHVSRSLRVRRHEGYSMAAGFGLRCHSWRGLHHGLGVCVRYRVLIIVAGTRCCPFNPDSYRFGRRRFVAAASRMRSAPINTEKECCGACGRSC